MAADSLVEREQDLALLGAGVAEAGQGRSALVVIEGPAGIGKTRLLAEARRLAHAAATRTLLARASELESELPFGVVRQLFDGTATGPLEPATGETRDASFAMLDAVYRVTATLAAEGPLVIAVDDLHWCDDPSLRFLNYLLRRFEGLGVSVLCTVRPREPRAQAPLVAEIVGDPHATLVRPRPLSHRAAAGLVIDALGGNADEAFSSACHTATGGNPLLLRELLSTLQLEGVTPDAGHIPAVADIGPRAVSRAVLVRLGRLSDDALRLARAASVVRERADLPLLAELAGLDTDAAASASRALVAAEIFSNNADAMFVHPLVGAAVYEDVAAHDRSFAHERAAECLRERGESAGAVAVHLALAPPRAREWVVDALEAAARDSLRAGSPAGAARYLARALSEPPPPERRARTLLALGTAEAGIDVPSAIGHLTEAFEHSRDPAVRRSAVVTLARALLFNDRADEAVALIRRAGAELELGADDRLALDALERMGPAYGVVLADAPLVDSLAPGAGPGARMLAAVTSRQWAYGGGNADDCARLALDALHGGELIGADNGYLSITAILTLVRADRPEADAAWAAVLQESRARGSLAAKAGSSLWRGYAFLRRGEFDAAEAALDDSIAEFRLLGIGPLPLAHHAAFLSAIARERGALDRARDILDAVEVPRNASDAARYWLDARCELLLAEGRFDAVPAVAEDAERRFAHLANPIDTPARSHRAVALYHLGHREEGVGLARESLELARRWGAPGAVARALRVLGTLEREAGLDHLTEAVQVVERSVARLEHAKALVALGTCLRHARRPTDAREPLREGLAIADALGAGALVTTARHELRAAGARPRTTALAGPAALTPAERRVTERAAAGETNRAIAEALFVTDKTVELHLRNAYRKLGVRSRAQLPGAL